jgi:thiol-disulfide isomerase/thioredoxin
LGITQEFNGKVKEARVWYAKLVSDHAASAAAKRAGGALRRLDLKGKPFDIKGHDLAGAAFDSASLQGKVVLVLFWDTQCKPCTEDLPQLRALYEQYHDRGFEILGVNLDLVKDDVKPYLTEHRVNWPQIYEPGGFEGEPALSYGIISLPTMFLVDQEGRVLHRSASITDLKTLLPEIMKKE